MRVYLHHLRANNYCHKGSRLWLERLGLSWSDAVANGVDADVLRAADDDMATRLVKFAEEEMLEMQVMEGKNG